MGVRVIVDRDSVGMADDHDPHLEVWEVADDTRVGELVPRVVETCLPHVAGSVAWSIGARHRAESRHGPDGRVTGVERTGGTTVRCSFVTVPLDRDAPTRIARTDSVPRAGQEIRQAVRPTATGEYVFTARYHSGGYPMPLEAYRARVRG